MTNYDDVAGIGTDPDVFEAFYRRHLDPVQRFVARRVDDPHTAADLTADVFLAVIDAAAAYRPELGPPRAWVFGITRNVVQGEHRRRARQLRAFGRSAGRRVLAADAVERAVERIDAEREARGLQALPAGLRSVLELVVVDQLTVSEAAAVLGIPAGTARVRLHRARRRLADDWDTGRHTPAGVSPADQASPSAERTGS